MSSDDYEVGYGKPPKHRRFQKGRSGNPRGRPKGARSFASALEQELGRPILVKEGGVARRVSKQEAIAMRLVEQALKGDIRATNSIAAQLQRSEPGAEAPADAAGLPASDQAIIERFFARRRGRTEAEAAATGASATGTEIDGPDDA